MEHRNTSEIGDIDVKEDDDLSISEDRRRSSSSISSSDIESAITDFSNDDSSQIDKHEHVDEQDEKLERSDESALDSPPVQVMERPAESSGYRIPSHVFARDKPNNPEWSMCSNESLFSIHTGNMSFTRDQFNWLLKSGELGAYGPVDIQKSGELPPLSPRNVPSLGEQKNDDLPIQNQVPVSTKESPKSEDILADDFNTIPLSPPPNKEDEFRGTNTLQTKQVDDFGGMKKYDTESETKEKTSSVASSDESHLSKCVSHHSDASFAFPVLAEIGRDKSITSGHSHSPFGKHKNSEVDDKDTGQTPAKATTEATTASSWLPSYLTCCCSCCG